MTDHPIILFDGICNLCNKAVQYVIKNDPGEIFKFATLQSQTGQRLLKEHKLSSLNFNSFILIQEGHVFTRSTAALKIAQKLNGHIKLLYGFIIVPTFIRDPVYNFLSKNRYKWFGKRDACMNPTPSLQRRFLN